MKRLDFFEITLISAGFFVPLIYMEKHLGVFTITITEVMTILITIGFMFRAMKEKIALELTMADKIFLALILWSALSLPEAIDLRKSLREFFWLAESALIFYMVSHGIQGKKSINRLLRAWSYGAVIISVLGLSYYFSLLLTGGVATRIASTLRAFNSLSGYLILYLPVMVALKYGKRWDQRYFWGLSATIVGTALVVTYTRGGWFAAIIALLVMAFTLKDKKFIGILALYITIYVVTLPTVGDPGIKHTGYNLPPVADRAVSSFRPNTDTSGKHRFQLWLVAVKMWQEHPIAGVGIGNYYKLHNSYLERYPKLNQGYQALEPHNSFLKFLAETGIVGLTLFLILLCFLLYQGVRLLLPENGAGDKPITVGILCGILAFLLQSNTNSLFHDPRVAFGTWMILGLIGQMIQEEALVNKPLIFAGIHSKSVRPA